MSQDEPDRELEIHEVEWDALAPHAKRQALFVVSNEITLRTAAEAVRDDRVDEVGAWLESGVLVRPTPEAAADFSARNARLAFVIVQPWVLAQERRD